MKLFKNKYDKLKREDVVNAIINLNNDLQKLEKEIELSGEEIDSLMEKGKKEKSPKIKIVYAKKINFLKNIREENMNKMLYTMYNIRLMEKLKVAIDDNQFFDNKLNMPLNKLLGDQKGLANFLNKALNRRIKAEEILTDADDLFNEVSDSYQGNDSIYGVQENDEELLSIFEDSNTEEDSIFVEETNQRKAKEGENN